MSGEMNIAILGKKRFFCLMIMSQLEILIRSSWQPNLRKSKSPTVSLIGFWTSCRIGPRRG